MTIQEARKLLWQFGATEDVAMLLVSETDKARREALTEAARKCLVHVSESQGNQTWNMACKQCQASILEARDKV